MMNMKKLYIIGNGFDIAHGLKTSYWDFRNYLEEHYHDFLYTFEYLYDIGQFDSSDLRITEAARQKREESIQSKLWSEFENNLGKPDFDMMLNDAENMSDSMADLDGGLVDIKDTMDEYWKNQYEYIEKLNQYVKEWIESVDTTHVKPKKKGLMRSEDYFLNFNYTDLLENVYGIEDVLHIHGAVNTVGRWGDDDPIMGHHNYEDIESYKGKAYEADEAFREDDTSIYNAIVNYLDVIYKDTDTIIREHDAFWRELRDVNKVIIIGWSAGSADLSYLRKIKNSVNESAKWYVYFYDDKAHLALQQVMLSEGIEEKFTVKYFSSSRFWD